MRKPGNNASAAFMIAGATRTASCLRAPGTAAPDRPPLQRPRVGKSAALAGLLSPGRYNARARRRTLAGHPFRRVAELTPLSQC